MIAPAPAGHDRKYLVLTAMIFAVAMMFVDQTINRPEQVERDALPHP
jgi:hypothetical protein